MSRTLLICDDTMFMRTLIANALGDAGFTVVGHASTGTEAVERYQELRPDLVTMDVVMPEIGGLEAVRRIVAEDPGARILVCSAIGQVQKLNEARAAGARGVIVKPFTPAQLVAAAEAVLAEEAA